jgi:hypothetical protein
MLLLAAILLATAPALASAQALPDLVPEASDIHFDYGASVAEGDVAEGCASSTTDVDLLRLALTTRNDGPGDLTLGDPLCPDCTLFPGEFCGDSRFICSPAGGHNHPHYDDFLRYELIDANGEQVGLGGKRSFCLRESGCLVATSRHSCSNQGLSAGCWDIYPAYLGCQYIEISGVRTGHYTLRVTADPLGEIAEANESNNVVEYPVEIAREGDFDVMLEGGSLLLVSGRLLRLHARRLPAEPAPPEASDPRIAGAVLRVADLGRHEEVELALPASGWRKLGKHAWSSYHYRGSGSVTDPCRSVVVTRQHVFATCRGAAVDVPLPATGEIFVQLAIGDFGQRFCASFGGKTRRNGAKQLLRFNAPPSTCSPFHD